MQINEGGEEEEETLIARLIERLAPSAAPKVGPHVLGNSLSSHTLVINSTNSGISLTEWHWLGSQHSVADGRLGKRFHFSSIRCSIFGTRRGASD